MHNNIHIVPLSNFVFDDILPLLSPPNLAAIDNNKLLKIFSNASGQIGIGLSSNGKLVGCLGFIVHKRISTAGAEHNVINLTSFSVLPDYRGYGVLLLRELKKFDHILFTVLSPSPISLTLFQRINKATITCEYYQTLEPGNLDAAINLIDAGLCRHTFSASDHAIYEHHKGLECECLVAAIADTNLLLITKITNIQGIPHVEILYFSHQACFEKNTGAIVNALHEKHPGKKVILSLSDTPEGIINEKNLIRMKEPIIVFGSDKSIKIPFMSLFSERVVLGL